MPIDIISTSTIGRIQSSWRPMAKTSLTSLATYTSIPLQLFILQPQYVCRYANEGAPFKYANEGAPCKYTLSIEICMYESMHATGYFNSTFKEPFCIKTSYKGTI